MELRKARLVDLDRYVTLYWHLGKQLLVIDSLSALCSFMRNGGDALIEKTVAERWCEELLTPKISVPNGLSGFVDPQSVPKAFLAKTSKSTRDRIIRRDNHRCRICGRGPEDNEDIELNVHHIRPRRFGGLTKDSNLITLCRTCHKNLKHDSPYELRNMGLDISPPDAEKLPLDWSGPFDLNINS